MGHSTLENKGHSAALYPGNNVRHLRTKAAAKAESGFAPPNAIPLPKPKIWVNPWDAATQWLPDIKTLEIEWLWDKWIPKGFLGAIAGDPKAGKSTIGRELFAAFTMGKPLPGETKPREPINCWWITAEESGSYQVKPSLIQHGADPTRVWVTGHFVDIGTPAGRRGFEEFIRRNEISFVLIDSMSSWSNGIDMNGPSVGASWMQPIKEIAEATGCTVVYIRHHKKDSKKGPAGQAALGSTTITAMTRFDVTIEVNKDDSRHVFRAAGNFGPPPAPLSAALEAPPEGSDALPLWKWRGAAPAAPGGAVGPKLSKAQARTLQLIPADGEPISEDELKARFFEAKISGGTKDSQDKAFRRAIEELEKKALISRAADGNIVRNQ